MSGQQKSLETVTVCVQKEEQVGITKLIEELSNLLDTLINGLHKRPCLPIILVHRLLSWHYYYLFFFRWQQEQQQ